MGANCIIIQGPWHAGRSELCVCVCRGAAVCVSKRGEHRELARQEAREEHCGEIKMKFEKFASHLALSLPCDLMKFMYLYLDRKATSWLLVLKRKNITYFGLGNIW